MNASANPLPVRVAVIGAGAMGRNHVRVYRELPQAELVGIADQDRAVTEKLGQLYGVRAYQDYREMLARERPEAVSLAVPTQLHAEMALELLQAGCHVLVEKPIAAACSEGGRMIAAAEQCGRVLMVGHIERFNPAVVELKRRLDSGQLGALFQVHARRLGPYPTRIQDVGVVLDLAPHDLDLMRYLVGSEVSRLYAEARCEMNAGNEDLMTGLLRFENGVLGVLELNWVTPTKIRELYVTGERGMFMVNYITQDLYFYENALAQGEDWHTLSLLRGVSEGAMTRYAVKKAEPLRVELEAFLRWVCSGEPPGISAQDACVVLDLATRLLESVQRGTALDLRAMA
ncbi:MAG: Gfo/Idh/MocA family oxidoreductase [Chloroflexota bacterium]